MQVALITPPNVYTRKGVTMMVIPPIGLAYIASALERRGDLVQFIDGVAHYATQNYKEKFGLREFEINGARRSEIVERVNAEIEMIGITCMFMHHWPMVRALIGDLRKRFPAVTIVVGGEHASGGYEQILLESSADIVVLGEGEATIVEIAEVLTSRRPLLGIPGTAYKAANGMVCCGPARPRISQLNTIARPAWHLVPVDIYMRRRMFHGPSLGNTMPIMATRGCPYQCTFCTSPQMWTTKWIARDPADVVDEMGEYRKTYGANDFQFVDLTAIVKKDWILAFCKELKSRNWPEVKWQLPSGTRSEAIDYEVAKELIAAGCSMLSYAPESGSRAQLKRIKKKVNTDKLIQSILDVRRAGITVECFIVLAFPDETIVDILWTYLLIARFAVIGVESVVVSGYRPVPGTESSALLIQQGKIVWNDELYMDLTESAAVIGGRSYNPLLSDRQVAMVRAAGYMLFFTISFLVRPWRPIRILANLLKGTHTSKLEKALSEIIGRLRPIARAGGV